VGITDQSQQIRLFLEQDGFIPVLEKHAIAAMIDAVRASPGILLDHNINVAAVGHAAPGHRTEKAKPDNPVSFFIYVLEPAQILYNLIS
jgi:hypothetical protein